MSKYHYHLIMLRIKIKAKLTCQKMYRFVLKTALIIYNVKYRQSAIHIQVDFLVLLVKVQTSFDEMYS